MAAVIALRPETDRGSEILDQLEQVTEVKPTEIDDDGTRRYNLSAEDADTDAFDPMLNKVDENWRDHIENWRGERRDYPPGD
jgi:hypothetical protein